MLKLQHLLCPSLSWLLYPLSSSGHKLFALADGFVILILGLRTGGSPVGIGLFTIAPGSPVGAFKERGSGNKCIVRRGSVDSFCIHVSIGAGVSVSFSPVICKEPSMYNK